MPTTIPNAAGANAAFTAQGAPTSITLNANVTVGHVQFDGANAWTVANGAGDTLTLQPDVGGVSTLVTPSGTHTIAPNLVLNAPLNKLGAGSVVLGGTVSGTSSLFVSAGSLTIPANANNTSGSMVLASGATLNLGSFSDYGFSGRAADRYYLIDPGVGDYWIGFRCVRSE